MNPEPRVGSPQLPLIELSPEVVSIARRLEEAGYETWAVGGALRDFLLGEPGGDVDLATAAPPETVLKLFRHTVPVGIDHGTVGVLDSAHQLHEVTTFRRDVETDGRHAVVRFGVSLNDDLARRDFTINALAYHPIKREWVDPFGGAADLRAGVVRAVGNPSLRFQEDHLRVLRGIRFAARFDLEIEPVTWAAAVAAGSGLTGLSAERVRDEWFKGLRTSRSLRRLVRLWHDVGAARIWLPTLAAEWPGVEVPAAERDPIILTALCCANSPILLRRLRCSNDEVARAEALSKGPPAPASLNPADVRRWLAQVTDAADDRLALDRARQGSDPDWASIVAGIRSRGEATTRAQLAVSGNDLMEMGVPPSPRLGALLDHLLEQVLADPAINTRERLLEVARAWR